MIHDEEVTGPENTPFGYEFLCMECRLSDFLLKSFAPTEYLQGDFLQKDGTRNNTIYLEGVAIGDLDTLDPSTIGQNLLDLTYPGGDNPMTYNKKYDYTYVPSDLSEYPAIGHDRRYDRLGIEGAKGLFTDTRAIGADWKFVKEELTIAFLSMNLKTKYNASVLGIGLGLFSLPKTFTKMTAPGGPGEVAAWYSFSNIGVTNTPDKK